MSKGMASLAALTTDLNQDLVLVPYCSFSCQLAEMPLNTNLGSMHSFPSSFFNLYKTAGDNR